MINHVSAKLLTTLIRCQRINNFANTVSGYWLTMMTQKILQNCFSMFIWGLVLKISLHFRFKKKIVKRKKMIFNLCNSLSSQKQKRFAKPFLPVQMGLRSNLLSKNKIKKLIKFFFFLIVETLVLNFLDCRTFWSGLTSILPLSASGASPAPLMQSSCGRMDTPISSGKWIWLKMSSFP